MKAYPALQGIRIDTVLLDTCVLAFNSHPLINKPTEQPIY